MRSAVIRALTDESNPPSHSSGQGSSASDRVSVLFLFLFSLLLYVGTTRFDFVVDDSLLLARNPYVLSFHYIKEIFSQDFWGFRGASGATGFYRPVVMVTLLVGRVLFGPSPAGYHLVNVILNGLVVVLVYRLARLLWPRGNGPLWAGALFAALPLHTENVAPISGISDLECALFMLLSAWIYLRPGDSRPRFLKTSSWLAAATFLLAALSKEVALVLPLFLIFYDSCLCPGGSSWSRAYLRRYLPFLVVILVYISLRHAALGSITKIIEANPPGLRRTVFSALGLTGIYVSKLVWPQHLAYLVKFHPPEGWLDLDVLLGVVFLLLAAATFFRSWRQNGRISFAILWFFLSLAPALNVRWLGLSAYGERYLYIPSVTFCWLAGEGLSQLSRSIPREQRVRLFVAQALPWVLLGLWIGRTTMRLPDWTNDKTLAIATLREAPDSAISHIYLGNCYRQEGERTLARQQYVEAIALDPLVFEAYFDLALVLKDDGAVEGTRALFRRAAEVNPRAPEVYYGWGVIEQEAGKQESARQLFERAVALNPNYGDALNNLGVISMDQGRLDEAQSYFADAARADPFSLSIHLNLGILHSRKGDFRQAESEFRRAMELAPRSEAPYLSLAGLYEQQGKQAAALALYEKAVEVHPGSPTALFRLGVLALKMGDAMKAAGALEKAERIEPRSALIHTQLGLAYRAAGRIMDARRELGTGLRLAPDDDTARQALQELKR